MQKTRKNSVHILSKETAVCCCLRNVVWRQRFAASTTLKKPLKGLTVTAKNKKKNIIFLFSP